MAKWQCSKCGHTVSGTNPPPSGGSGTKCNDGTFKHIWGQLSRYTKFIISLVS